MTAIAAPAPLAATVPNSGFLAVPAKTSSPTDALERSQLLARVTGFMFLVTFASAIPPMVTFYVPALKDPAFVLGGGFHSGIAWGALFELVLILANVATALALYPILKHRFPVLSLSYVAARLTENAFIAFGIVALLALNTLRLHAGTTDEGSLLVAGQTLVALHDWTFRLGPGVVVGAGNGLILGYMMWRSKLVPRPLSVLGLIGGPAILVAGVAVLFGYIEAGSVPQAVATLPEFFWELFLGLWLLVRGFSSEALGFIPRAREGENTPLRTAVEPESTQEPLESTQP